MTRPDIARRLRDRIVISQEQLAAGMYDLSLWDSGLLGEAAAEIERLREALTAVIAFRAQWEEADGHHFMCDVMDGDSECSCGIDAARAAINLGEP